VVGRTIGLVEGLEDEEELGVLAFPVSRDKALGVMLHGMLVEVMGAGTILEEGAASLVGAEPCREGMEDTFQVETSVAWVSCRVACSGPCTVDLVACLEGMTSAFLAVVVT
jgi:hypothetical protein